MRLHPIQFVIKTEHFWNNSALFLLKWGLYDFFNNNPSFHSHIKVKNLLWSWKNGLRLENVIFFPLVKYSMKVVPQTKISVKIGLSQAIKLWRERRIKKNRIWFSRRNVGDFLTYRRCFCCNYPYWSHFNDIPLFYDDNVFSEPQFAEEIL